MSEPDQPAKSWARLPKSNYYPDHSNRYDTIGTLWTLSWQSGWVTAWSSIVDQNMEKSLKQAPSIWF